MKAAAFTNSPATVLHVPIGDLESLESSARWHLCWNARGAPGEHKHLYENTRHGLAIDDTDQNIDWQSPEKKRHRLATGIDVTICGSTCKQAAKRSRHPTTRYETS